MNDETPMNEEQIENMYKHLYDQPKVTRGYIDEKDDQPYRYIKHWYFCSSSNPDKRLPLPKNQNFPNDYVLVGWLQPVSQKMEPEFVKFENLNYYAVDRSPEYRGYWVATQRDDDNNNSQPLYWLQEPCTLKQRRNSRSQEEVQFNARVALAAISLLCERVFTGTTGLRYVNRSVEQVLEEQPLLQTTEMTKDKLLTLEKRILAFHKGMIGAHMRGHYAKLTKNSKFLRSLSKLPVKGNLSDPDVLWWTEAAEDQLQQCPWGGPRSDYSASENESESKKKSTESSIQKQSGVKRRLSETGTTIPTKDNRKQDSGASSAELSESKRKRCRRVLPGFSSLKVSSSGPSADSLDEPNDVETKKEENLSGGQNLAFTDRKQSSSGDTESSYPQKTGATCTIM